MTEMRQIKTYNDATLSGAPIVVKFDNITYAYAKFYPTISAAAGATSDDFSAGVTGYADATLSGNPIIIQVPSGGRAYYIRGYDSVSAETEVYAGIVPEVKTHAYGYLYGTPRIGVLTINSTPYYVKMYPYQVSSAIYDLSNSVQSYDDDYISIIGSPTEGNFPVMSIGGELISSNYGPTDFDAAGTAATQVSTHESTYNHENYNTAYGWGNHAGIYDPVGTGHTEAAAHVTSHESTYAHANYDTAYGWGNHASAGYAASGHNHSGTYDPAGTGHTEAAAHITAHEAAYNHANIESSHNHDDRYYTETELVGSGGAPGVLDTKYAAASHESNSSNPHSVTKSQVGLGSVENTALSTWAGSSNITTIGTLTSLQITNATIPYANLYSSDTSSENVRNWGFSGNRSYYGDYALYMSLARGGNPQASDGMLMTHWYSNGVVTFPLGGLHVGGDNWQVGENNLYVDGNCSAASFTDRTPMFSGDAVTQIKGISADAEGNLDHTTLPVFAQATYKVLTDKGKHRKEAAKREGKILEGHPDDYEDVPGRDLGNMVSVLTRAIQQLTGRIELLEDALGNARSIGTEETVSEREASKTANGNKADRPHSGTDGKGA